MIDQKLMLPIGTVLHSDMYRVVRYIASGGFGNTYEVEHVKLGKRYCLKEFFMRGINLREGNTVTVSVENNRATFEQMRAKFFKEAKRMARIENSHVVEVTDFFEENETAYYVMKLIDGQSLAAKMAAQGRPFTEAELLSMLPQVLSALRYVHSKGIYHLDMKPANIMVNAEGHLWLIDFGASKQLTAVESQTFSTTSDLCYTPFYAPWEQVESATEYIGPWTDFYSLGATLYNLLTNRVPPKSTDIEERGAEAFTFPETTSDAMRRLILWLMQPQRNDRPQTADDIERKISGLAGRSGKRKTSPAAGKRNYRLWYILAAIFTALVVLLFLLRTCKHKPIEVDDEEETWLVCPDNDHPHMIDMGLPSGTLWACCNVGASAPQEYGGYYAWGETSEKNNYVWTTYDHFNDYNSTGVGTVEKMIDIGADIAGTKYDAATVNWDDPWRMPTSKQCHELLDYGRSEWTTKDGVNGWEITGPNGGTIFLPAAGWRYSTVLDSVGTKGGYWASTRFDSGTNNPNHQQSLYAIRLVLRDNLTVNGLLRYFGQPVRPVCTRIEERHGLIGF